MRKLSAIPAPALAGVIREKTKLAAAAEIANCTCDGADMIDLHLSCLEKYTENIVRELVNFSKLPILALNYNQTTDWKDAGYTEEARIESLRAAAHAGVAGIDMQGYTFHTPSKSGFCGEDIYSFTKNNPREIVTNKEIIEKQCDFIDEIHSMGAEVLLSCHPGVPMSGEQIVDLALFLEKRNPDILKIVTPANNEEEMIESIRSMLLLRREVKTPVSYHANGKFGGLTRILNPALGGQIAFCVDRFSETSTMEQLDLKCAKTAIESLRKLL